MRKKRAVYGAIGIVLFAFGFFIATLLQSFINTDATDKKDTVEIIPSKVEQSGVDWINESGVIGTCAKVDQAGKVSYRVSVFLPSQHKTIEMDISRIETIILQDKDLVKMHYITQGDQLLFVQFIRDAQGRLQIEDERPVVVLDAGHGGLDNGEGSNDYGYEKDVTLAITLKQQELLKDNGIRVILTRSTDDFITLFERCEISNYVDADVFISNHINKNDGESSGIQVFHNLAGDEDLAYALAENLSKQGIEDFGIKTRRDERLPSLDFYFVHEYTHTNSYIIEYGFADFDQDAEMIHSNWEAMATSVCETLKSYLLAEQ